MDRHFEESHKPLILKALSIPSFRHLWLGQLFSQVGANMLLSILALRIYEITKSNAAVSGLFIAYGVPAVIFGMMAGAIVDHIDKRKVLAFCNISRSILIIPLFFFPETLPIVYVVMFINSLIGQFYLPAEAPLIPRLIPDKLLLTANSLFSFTFFASLALGFVLAGPVLKFTGMYGSFGLLLVLYLSAVWSVSRIPKQQEQVAGIINMFRKNGMQLVNQLMRDVKTGLGFCLRNKHILDALILMTGTQIVLAILGILGPGFADRILNIHVTDASVVILGPAVLGIVVGALWVGNYGNKFSVRRLTTFGISASGFILMMIATFVRLERTILFGNLFQGPGILVLTVVLFFLLGASNSFLDVPSNATLQREGGETMRGRIYGIVTALGGGIGIIPVVLGGILADILGIGKVLFGLGLLITLYGLIRLRRI